MMSLSWGRKQLKRIRAESEEAKAFYDQRLSSFLRFTTANISMPKVVSNTLTSIASPSELPNTSITWKDLIHSNYDIFINGADVVWHQRRGYIRREKMLDFQNEAHARKIAYAASFGRDYIPRENRGAIRRALQNFDAISVREKSSLQLLNSLGIQGAVHCCDSTLLLSVEEWAKVEREPRLDVGCTPCVLDANAKNNTFHLSAGKPSSFVFSYLLGPSRAQVSSLLNFCRKHDMPLVSIPYANAPKHDEPYGDYIVPACSPEEWVWLIHHADLVITDSFHGVVFSTIFKKKFIAVRRITSLSNFGNRLIDYLDTIGQEDKFCSVETLESLQDINSINWNYKEISFRMEKFITTSKRYLHDAIMCTEET